MEGVPDLNSKATFHQNSEFLCRAAINIGKMHFAQIMDLLPRKTFHRIVARHGGGKEVLALRCAEHFRVMPRGQLTYRQGSRDIQACPLAQATKLYHLGFANRWQDRHWPTPTTTVWSAGLP